MATRKEGEEEAEEKDREKKETGRHRERTVFTPLKSANSRSGISFFPLLLRLLLFFNMNYDRSYCLLLLTFYPIYKVIHWNKKDSNDSIEYNDKINK